MPRHHHDDNRCDPSTGLPSIGEVIEEIPSDELPPEGAHDYVVWSGTISGSICIDGLMADVFTLTFTDGVELTSGPIEDGHALIVQDTGFGLVTIELSRENC